MRINSVSVNFLNRKTRSAKKRLCNLLIFDVKFIFFTNAPESLSEIEKYINISEMKQ